MVLNLSIVSRGGGAVGTVSIDEKATVLDLKKEVHKLRPKLYPARQGLSIEKDHERVQLSAEDPLSKYELRDGFQIALKDLGPQIRFRPVYIIEYFGPMVLYPLFALRLFPVYGPNPLPLTDTQLIACFMWVTHFVKRTLETIYVHEFGDLTMPVWPNLIRNSAYYWGFGIACGYWLNQPWLSDIPSWHIYLGFPLMALCMLTNLVCHIQLSHLRKPGSSALVLPRGGLFEYLTAPNYVAEVCTWISFNILTGFTWAGIAFNLCGLYQMHQWALEKHLRYRKIFKDYPKQRKILIPFVY